MVSLKKENMENWYKTYKTLIAKRIKRITWASALAAEYAAMQGYNNLEGVQIKPDIIIAGIPVWNINKLGHAVSDEILKYRSMGGIFLAHQKGGKQTFKFTARIFGPMRFITYKLLEGLLQLGTEQAKPVKGLNDVTDVPGLSDVDLEFTSANNDVLKTEPQIKAGSLGSPFYSFIEQSEFNNAEYAFHRTFPIITDTKIYLDMYMETLVCRESVKFGKDVLEVECAFRHYQPPMYFHKSVPRDEGRRNFYTTFTPRKVLLNLKRLEDLINLGWITTQTLHYMYGEGKPELMFQKPGDSIEWEGNILVATMIGHFALSIIM